MLNLIILLCIICVIIVFSFINEIKLKIISLFSIGILVFCWIPIGVDYFIVKGFIQDTTIQWTKTEWAGFLGSYLGGGIGAIITLFGVWWQIKRDDKIKQRDKVIGVLKGILYSLNRNLESKNLDSINKRSFYILDYYYGDTIHSKFYTNYIYEIFPEIIRENYKVIFELDFGKEIIDLNELIKHFNQNYKFLSLELKKKKNIIRKIEKLALVLKNVNINELTQILEEIKKCSNFFSTNFSDKADKFSREEFLNKGRKIEEKIGELIEILDFASVDEALKNENDYLIQCLLSEGVILSKHSNIFKIMDDMKELKEKIEKEIKKLENQ